MNILLIEDSRDMVALITIICEGAGHSVTNIIGVASHRGGDFVGISPDQKRLPLDLAQFELALVDGGLERTALRPMHWGWDIIPYLVHIAEPPLTCIAISAEDSFNERMIAAGAVASVNKSDVGARLLPAITKATGDRAAQASA